MNVSPSERTDPDLQQTDAHDATTRTGSPTSLAIHIPGEPRPAELGRYRILAELGRGGMGVVYDAEDPELGRRVALKILAPGRHGEAARARLEREARVLAKLAHPNVVAIHDVGEQDGMLYLAMERIDGRTLRVWLREAPRSWPQILACFVAVGQGLVAAHEAGLVHRDFKPDNVLIDRRETPRVVDFGLARTFADEREDATTRISTPQGAADDLQTLTRSDAIMGTPAYMAPEQRHGRAGDPRSDQYAFCVALWEALYGERPSAETPSTNNLGRGVPRALRRILQRGLAIEPGHRWPSMAALLAALEAVPRRRRRLAVASVASVLVLSSGAATWAMTTSRASPAPPPQLCLDADAPLDAVWTQQRRTAVGAALELDADAKVAATRARALATLDRYADSLRDGFTRACRDHEERELVSPALHERRLACLGARVDAFDATLSVLGSLERSELGRAGRLLLELPEVDRCNDLDDLATQPAEPTDEEALVRIAEARAALARARVNARAARVPESKAALTRAEALVAQLDHPPLIAEFDYVRGRISTVEGDYEAAITQFEDAYHQALANGHDDLAIDASLELTFTYGYDMHEPERGLAWLRHAQSIVERNGSEIGRAAILHTRAEMLKQLSENQRAVELYAEALARKRELYAPGDPELASTLNNYANVLEQLDRLDEAEPALRESIEIKLEHFGELDPSTAGALSNLSLILWKRGDCEGASEAAAHARDIFIRVHGEDHISAAGSRLNLGLALLACQRPAEALVEVETALAIVRALDRPVPGLERKLLDLLGDSLRNLERPRESLDAFTQALELATELHGEDSPELAPELRGLAEAANLLGEHEQALAHATRVIELHAGDDGDPSSRGDAHLSAAEALLPLGRPDEARAHALAAREDLRDATGNLGSEREQVEALLERLDAE